MHFYVCGLDVSFPRRLSVCAPVCVSHYLSYVLYREQRVQAEEDPREQLDMAVWLEREGNPAGVSLCLSAGI